jgi:hypothetical protein
MEWKNDKKILRVALLASVGFMTVWSFVETKALNVVAGWTAYGKLASME